MKSDGWSWGDLAGELRSRGIDPNGADITESDLREPTPERCADRIAEREPLPIRDPEQEAPDA